MSECDCDWKPSQAFKEESKAQYRYTSFTMTLAFANHNHLPIVNPPSFPLRSESRLKAKEWPVVSLLALFNKSIYSDALV